MHPEFLEVLDRVPGEVAAGVSYHQSGGESLRSRSIARTTGVETVRPYQAFNAAVLHSQLAERGLLGGSGEFVTERQCGLLGGEVRDAAAVEETRFVLETGDRRGIGVGIAGSPAVVLRPGVYRVLHSGSQTTLSPGRDPRLVKGRAGEAAARDVVSRALAGAAVRLEPADVVEYGRDGDGLVLCHPGVAGFPSPAAWASSAVGALVAAVSDDSRAHADVRVARFETDALRDHRRRVRRGKGGAAEAAGDGADRAVSQAFAALLARASGVVARRESVRIDWDRPAGEPVFDPAGRVYRPKAPRLFKEHGVRQWEAFQRAALAGLCRHVGSEAERRAVGASGAVDRAGGLALVEAVAGPLPGLDHRRRAGAGDRAARAAMVGALGARSIVEAAGLAYVPPGQGEETAGRQARIVKDEGLRSLCADASNIGAWALSVDRGRELPVSAERAEARGHDGPAHVSRPAARPVSQQELSW